MILDTFVAPSGAIITLEVVDHPLYGRVYIRRYTMGSYTDCVSLGLYSVSAIARFLDYVDKYRVPRRYIR